MLTNTSLRVPKPSPRRPKMATRYFRLDRPEQGANVRKVLLGEVLPIITIIVLSVNIMMLIVFYKGKFSNSTHLILIAIAIADSLNGLFFLVPSMHFFTFNNDQDFVTYDWCLAYFILQLISRVSHGASLFYTVFLAAHRYVFVRFPFRANTLCSRKHTLVAISVIPMISFLVRTFLIVRMSSYYGGYTTSLLQENKTIYACARGDFRLSTVVMIWLPNFFNKIFPIATLIIFSALLVIELRQAPRSFLTNTAVNRQKVQKRRERNRRITLLTVAVVCCVLLTEIPGFIAQLVITYSSTQDCKECALVVLAAVNQLTITIFFPANFLIYCLVISRFRKTLLSILLGISDMMPSCCVAKFTRDLARSISTTDASVDDKDENTSSTLRTGISAKH
ncbi:hypothetical protein FSP39_022157 [Pinctada imbricata]|uniref:G-protein coupled receptors family 1 profile domain-containing protein n=1 Tax=Pinctada imbricata TaxID=66713 RepID=A0AA89BRQ0_PINIB|nr:hypothetical protein FSP39_022157 [Pinctada imbricata]